jgi:hypothetical protein
LYSFLGGLTIVSVGMGRIGAEALRAVPRETVSAATTQVQDEPTPM